ncbi:uncharacterized protein LOC130613745 isoform X2 [Hydractinia symbiolongicarpus]|uniref:uncharacterized protein LOC130613745 isoform X2 n=1 Tax=Hydractinia symbiolongicarpus TaxID=13093 RepID=UPI00254C035A|nr:uncharacterized protein LOC130613745 isoform X2 [Hydractinia symbiolongicarpus]
MNITEKVEEHSGYVFSILDVVSSIILTLSVIFNLLGVYLLKQHKSQRNIIQNSILVSMSLSEVLIALVDIVYMIAKFAGLDEETSNIFVYCEEVVAGLFFTYYTVLFMLTFDRLLAFVLLLKYHSIVTIKRTRCCIVVAWVVGVIIAFPFFFLSPDTFFETWKRRTVASGVAGREKMFVVTTIIIATFVLLVVIPDILYAYRFVIHKIGSDTEETIIGLCWELNYLCDPCIYIFLQKNIRTILLQKASKLYRKKEIDKITIFDNARDDKSHIYSFSNEVVEETKVRPNSGSFDTKM